MEKSTGGVYKGAGVRAIHWAAAIGAAGVGGVGFGTGAAYTAGCATVSVTTRTCVTGPLAVCLVSTTGLWMTVAPVTSLAPTPAANSSLVVGTLFGLPNIKHNRKHALPNTN